MDVIPHGELREIQARSDFLICETLGDENHQLLLTYSEIRSWGGSLDWHLFDNVSNKAEQSGTKLRRADGLPPVDSAHRGNEFGSRSIFQQIAHHTGTDGSHEEFFVRFHADQDGLKSTLSSSSASNLCRRPRSLKRVGEEHVELSVKCLARGCVGWPVLTDDDKIGALAEQPNQRFTQETILHHQEYADRGTGDEFAHGVLLLLGCWEFRPRALA